MEKTTGAVALVVSMPKAEPASSPLLLPVRFGKQSSGLRGGETAVPSTLTASVAREPAVMLAAVQLVWLPL